MSSTIDFFYYVTYSTPHYTIMGKKNKKRRKRLISAVSEPSARAELLKQPCRSADLTPSVYNRSSDMRNVVLRLVLYSSLVLVLLGVIEFRKRLLQQVLHEGPAFRERIAPSSLGSFVLDGQRYVILDDRDDVRSRLIRVMLEAVEHLRDSGFSYQHELGSDIQLLVMRGLSSRARIEYTAVVDEASDLLLEQSDGCYDGLVRLREPYIASTILIQEDFLQDDEAAHSAVIAHELFHLVSGFMPNRLWMEGLAEVFEDGCLKERKQRRGSVEGLVLSEEIAFALKEMHLHLRPFNNLNMYDSLTVSEQQDGAMQMSRFAAFFAWKEFMKDHPDFLVRFVSRLRDEIGSPQLFLPSEKALVRIASSIVPGSSTEPSFVDWYESQPAFKSPSVCDTLFGGRVVTADNGRPSIELVSGVWFRRTPLPGEAFSSHRLVSVDLVVLPSGGYEEVLPAPGKMLFYIPFSDFEYLDIKQRVEGAKFVRFYANMSR
jgi:hypothetical protein